MKTIFFMFLSLTALMGKPTIQDSVVEATFNGYVDEMYEFTDADGSTYGFAEIEASAAQKYDLDSTDLVGKLFRVTYKMDTAVDEEDEEYDIYVIVDLKVLE
ncbi:MULTISPECIES: hypothetical protein [Flavobacteriaceae]|uniref:hypothetical protein n=1 Tax=Flavobacteriaceae TaxID=49546 RepID=UPI00234A9163|nr:hypothetical protein [Muricauda sp. SP22]MDC6362919.1 hypothetical protein [Muricauda sp. SP22]